MNSLGANFRPHVKTSKCTPVALAQLAAGARGITVSTLKEARHFFAAGITDILYAVGISPDKLPQALALREAGCDLKVITDNIVTARAIVEFCRAHACTLEVWIEIDCDGHRSGIRPADEALLEVGRLLAAGPARLGGVLTHAGSSYACRTPAALAAIAEQERAGCVQAAERLRAAGLPLPPRQHRLDAHRAGGASTSPALPRCAPASMCSSTWSCTTSASAVRTRSPCPS